MIESIYLVSCDMSFLESGQFSSFCESSPEKEGHDLTN